MRGSLLPALWIKSVSSRERPPYDWYNNLTSFKSLGARLKINVYWFDIQLHN